MKLLVCEMAQQVKIPDGRLGTLRSIPVNHPVERKLLPFVLWPPQACVAQVHLYLCTN